MDGRIQFEQIRNPAAGDSLLKREQWQKPDEKADRTDHRKGIIRK